MVLLDTNVFVIDRFFKRDERYDANFDEVYPVTVLEPQELHIRSATTWFVSFSNSMFELISRHMTWSDAVLLRTAEEYGVEAIVTWNKKHFESRTTISVQTPVEFMAATKGPQN